MTTGSLPTLQDIYRARRTIGGHVVRTPLVPSIALSDAAGAPVHLKLEHQQITGSFKLRGAANALLSLDPEQRRRGVVAASTGNFGRALSAASKITSARCAGSDSFQQRSPRRCPIPLQSGTRLSRTSTCPRQRRQGRSR
jgi:threonine dehydratase